MNHPTPRLRTLPPDHDASPPGMADALGGPGRGAPLYGRSRETQALSMAFRRAAAGGAELVVLSGPAGIGKTTLVRKMRAPLGQQSGYFISGKFDQLQRDVPFSAIVSALQDLVRQLLTESQAQARAWRDAIVAAVGRNGRVIIDVVPALERIIGPQPPLALLEPTESQNRFNHVFQSFLQVFCRENRPLVMFLDDVQWADPASLRLLTSLLSAAGTHSLLVIASCRDNEVVATHPFMVAVKELERRGVPVHTVQVGALGWSDITQFVSDQIHIDADAAAPLAEIIREKTGGNPFFMRQFLQKLQSDALLTRASDTGAWQFDLAAIRALQITENVADLISQKIGRLDPDTRRIVSFAAAIGNRFELATLASVAECTPERAREFLANALREQLLAMLDPADTSDSAHYCFQHDRVQQSAYALVPAAARPALNLTIGRCMLASAGEDPSSQLFEIVNHMNQGIALIDSRAERLRLVKLNLLAATRARNSTAYDLATRACRSAIELLGWDAWGENYALAFEAHLRLAECQALIADFEGALASIDVALGSARSAADKGRLLTVRTHTFLSMGDMTGAVACGRQAVQLFGLDLPEAPEQVRERLQSEIGAILGWAQQHSIEALLELPPMTDPERVALMSLLMHCVPPAYQVNPELFALICCKMVTLSIEHGNSPMSAKGYGSFAAILSGILGNYRDGDRFGKLGVDLCERLNDVTVRSACYFTWAAFASSWVRPIEESTHALREGVRWGMASGDHPHAAYCSAFLITHELFRGSALTVVHDVAESSVKLLDHIGDSANRPLVRTRRRYVEWLRAETTENTLDGAGFEEAEVLRELQVASVSKSILAQFQSLRLMARYFAGNYLEACRIARALDDMLVFVPGMLTVAEHALYQCLSITAAWHDFTGPERAEFGQRLDAQLRVMAGWAESCPRNFAAMHLVVSAEHARVHGDAAGASERYERAIAAARDSGPPYIEAIANELAMRHWRASASPRAAAAHARAIAAYEAWGATRKARALRAAG
ncbi:MAG TPA: AAA family ATPase [Steroidobacteraceae bacterium]|nr:AAA family ATPase [Steroidobacteraceae bacterium]